MPDSRGMFRITLHHQIQHLRRRAGYRQRAAAGLAGIPAQRWNHIERGTRRPTPTERLRIQSLLGPLSGFLRPPGIVRALRSEGRKVLPKTCPFLVLPERPPHTRFLSATQRHPRLVNRLMSTISKREDLADCEYLCNQLALGSSDEAVFVLHLLAAGARPMYVIPGYLPTPPCPIVDPSDRSPVAHRPFPCFWLDGGLYFFQVSFSTPRIYTVDVLRWKGEWRVIEIDGSGHDATDDVERTAALKVPVLRLSGREISSPDFRLAA